MPPSHTIPPLISTHLQRPLGKSPPEPSFVQPLFSRQSFTSCARAWDRALPRMQLLSLLKPSIRTGKPGEKIGKAVVNKSDLEEALAASSTHSTHAINLYYILDRTSCIIKLYKINLGILPGKLKTASPASPVVQWSSSPLAWKVFQNLSHLMDDRQSSSGYPTSFQVVFFDIFWHLTLGQEKKTSSTLTL